MSDRTCNLCGSTDTRGYHVQSYRELFRCRNCGLVYADPLPTNEEKHETERLAYEGEVLPETAEFFRNCSRDYKPDAVIHGFGAMLEWIETVCEPGRILDVGAGTGVFLHLARERGWEPHGIDICDLSAEKAAHEFSIDVQVGDFMQSDLTPESFDCITMLDVLEHCLDPTAFLARARSLLRPGGVLFVAVPNQRSLLTVLLDRYIWLGGPGADWFLDRLYVSPHLYYFNPRLLAEAIRRAGMETIGVRGGNVYLGRYRLPFWMRTVLALVLQTGSLVGMSARVMVLARNPSSSRARG